MLTTKTLRLWLALQSLLLAGSLHAQMDTVQQNGVKAVKPSYPLTQAKVYEAPTAKQAIVTNANGFISGAGSEPTVFSGKQMNETNQTLLNGISPLVEFQSVQGNVEFATEGVSDGIAVPSDASIYQVNAGADYVTTSGVTPNVVARYSQCRVLVNGGKCWGTNPVAMDTAGLTSGVVLTDEFDIQPQNAASAYANGGVQINLFAAKQGNFFNALSVNKGQLGTWAGGLSMEDGSIGTGLGVYFGQLAAGMSATQSQYVLFHANSGSRVLSSEIYADQFSDIVLAPPASGGIAMESPSAMSGTGNYYAPALKWVSNEYNGRGWAPSIWSFSISAPSKGAPGFEYLKLTNSGSQAPANAQGMVIPNELIIDTAGGGSSSIQSTSKSPVNFTLPSTSGQLALTPLTGTTETIRGTALSASCDSGTVKVAGAIVGHPVIASSTTGLDVGGAFNLRASVTSEGTVTVYICGTGTPMSLAYNVTVF